MSKSPPSDPSAHADMQQLVRDVYSQLHRLARSHLHRERRSHTIQATALVHEAYLRLATQERAQWVSKSQFLRVASEMMRRILVNYERDRSRLKRGGQATTRALSDGDLTTDDDPIDLIVLDEALEQLKEIDERKVELVHLRFFAGLSLGETAAALGMSLAHAKREWAMTRSWLMRAISTTGEDS